MSRRPQSFASSRGRVVLDALIATIDEHAAMLSEIDGAIGDGDHGINMRKGFLWPGRPCPPRSISRPA